MVTRYFAAAVMVTALFLGTHQAIAMDAAQVPEKKRTALNLYLAAEEVPGFLSAAHGKSLFLDVRTPAEITFVGMPPTVDANVPILLGPGAAFDEAKATLALVPNPDFLAEVERRLAARGLGRDATVVVICRSGDRSAVAADMLAKGGFAHVWSVVDGFEGDLAKEGPEAGHRVVNGWKNKGLPWGYRLDKAKMYRISD